MEDKPLRVVNRTTRYSFDGETGVCILKGTRGSVSAMTISTLNPRHLPSLTVFWDTAICQVATNDEPSVYSNWEESGVDPNAVHVLHEEEEGHAR